uniref:CHK domain-containing protein n=1 Tax=Rhodnius prolixus TaxID=13249 RepID=T1HHK8_RHOPR
MNSAKEQLEEMGWLEVMLRKHSRENSVAKVVRVEIEPAVAKGENYASVVTRAKVHIVIGSGRRTVKSVIIKRLPEKELYSKFLEEYSLFKTETKMYADVLSEMEYLMLEKGDMDEKLWPEYVGHKAYDTIIFNDLREMNYSVVDRKEMLDEAHGYLAIRSLARFHAMSVIMRIRGIINPTDFAPMFFISNTKATNNLIKGGMKLLARVMKDSWGPEWIDTAERIANAEATCCDKLEELRQVDDQKLNVLNHGDFWTSNILFKYSPCSGHDYPIGIRFVDFQMCHWNSYAFDVIHFLYVSLQYELRLSQYEKLIEAYHESLLFTLKFYDYDSEKIPSLQDVFDELQQKSFYAFICLAAILPVVSTPATNALDLEKLMLDGDDVIGHNPEIYRYDVYKRRMKIELTQFVRDGII